MIDRMRALAAKLNHPLLACNCYNKDSGELAYPAFTVIERSGVRVGSRGHRRAVERPHAQPDG